MATLTRIIQGLPKVSHTFVFAISSNSLGAQKKHWCQIQEEGWEILYSPSNYFFNKR
jgi:hypothetical protein